MSNKIFFTPGPTQLFYTYQDHLKTAIKNDIPSISHRSKQFQMLFAETREALSNLLGLTESHEIYFTGSANEIWERTIQNLVDKQSHHFVNGAFASKYYDYSISYQKEASIELAENGRSFTNYLIPEQADLIAITLNETSNGFSFPTDQIEKLKKAHPEKIMSVDGVSALPCIPLDFNYVDTSFFSVQKCFGMPAGLGIWIVNQQCIEKANQLESKGTITGSYHKLSSLKKEGLKNQTPETPNVLGIYILGKIAEDMLITGIHRIRNETIYKATILYDAIERNQTLSPFIKDKNFRSKTVVVADTISGNEAFLRNSEEKGWVIGKGYGEEKQHQIRIANFPMHSKELIEQLVDFIVEYQ